VFEVLNLPLTAKVAGVGGYNVSLKDNDPGIAYFNPSLLDSVHRNNMAMSWGGIFYKYSDVGYGSASYANRINQYNYAVNLVMLNYGVIHTRDELGQSTGNESAADYVIAFSASEHINKYFTWGFTVKPIISYLAGYSSYAIAGDFGLTLHDTINSSGLSLVARNFGRQIKPYYEDNYEKLPFEVDLGYSKKFPHAPFRFSVTYRHLQKFDLDYISDNSTSATLTADTTEKKASLPGKILNHIVVGAELIFSKNFYISMGYNIRRRKELKLSTKSGMVGYSLGAGVRIARIQISYAHQYYSIAGGTSTFTVNANLDDIMRPFKRKKAAVRDENPALLTP